MKAIYSKFPPKDQVMGLLRRNIGQKVHQLQMVMEEEMDQKNFDKVSEKLERIDEEI